MGQVNCSFSVTAAAGDTCDSLSHDWDITRSQFISWNPSVGSECSVGVQAGKDYCVEATITPAKQSGSQSISSSVLSSSFVTVTTSTTSTVASTTPVTSTTDSASVPSPTQQGLVAHCQNYYKVQPGDTCNSIVSKYGTFAASDLENWNPAIGSACTSLWVDYYICVGVTGTQPHPVVSTTTTLAPGPSPTQPGLISACTRYHQVQSGDTCQSIVTKYDTFSLPDFYKWNPAVGDSCSSLWLTYYVCIGVPGTPSQAPQPTQITPPVQKGPQPQQAGISGSCNKYHLVQPGDYCQKIADDNHIPLQQFYKWNPAVGADCKSLWAGYNVCVGST